MPTIAAAAVPSDLLPVRFSWNTLPVYFHSQNSTGPWSDDALVAISRYPLATIEKEHGGARAPVSPSSSSSSLSSSTSSWAGVGGGVIGIAPTYEETGAEACRRIAGGEGIEDLDFDDATDDGGSAERGTPAGIYYLNSVIDWPFNNLHALMVDHPEWRLKNSSAQDILILDRVWGFNLSVPECREAWLADCLDATRAGCSGCYVDKSAEHLWFDDIMSPRDRVMFEEAHLDTLKELNARLRVKGKFAINNNQGLIPEGTTAMMIEDFAATERCVHVLAEVVERGLAVEVHAGYYDDDDRDGGNGTARDRCIGGGTNAVAAFLISAGTKSYYHCSTGWESDPTWPAVPDEWLDWPTMYDRPLGAPRGRAKKVGDVWYRRFGDVGASVAFDGRLGNGTIRWGDGTVQRGRPNGLDQLRDGCKWTDLFAREKEPSVISQPLSLS